MHFILLQESTAKSLIAGITIGVFMILFLGLLILSFVFEYRKRQKVHKKEIQLSKARFEQQLLQSRLETQEETFATLGKELHDNVGQLLNSAKLLIGVTQRTLDNPPDTLAAANETLGTAINELRSLSKSLNNEWLQQFDFIQNLETEIKRINASGVLQIYLYNTGRILLEADKQIILFRIVQEALQNAIKHARSSVIKIHIEGSNKIIEIVIADNGKGMDINTLKGVGILNIQQRSKILGGAVNWQSGENKGTTVTIQIPVTEL
jgi:signal transduction histidine kinase